jgi:hypothetical protein
MAHSIWHTSVHASSIANSELAEVEYLMRVAERNGQNPDIYRFRLIKAQAKVGAKR